MNPAFSRHRLLEVFTAFFKLGCTAFGGPAAYISMFRHEFVQNRKWLDDEQFLDLLGATNLIPGPNATEMAIHLGFLRAGWFGLVAGGLAFTLPGMLAVLGLSWLYVQYGSTPEAGWLLYGIKPVMIAIIIQALWELGRKSITNKLTAAAGTIAVLLYFWGINEISLLLISGLGLTLVKNWHQLKELRHHELPVLLPSLSALASVPISFNFSTLFLVFLKIGAILYGSGYVLVAFMRADLVTRLGWLTEQQLVDSIAIGQITPGPLFTSATFVGYLLGGLPGALIATLGIFLPSYIFVAISNPIIPKLRQSPWASGLLDGVIVASLSLMAVTTWQLGLASLIDPFTILIMAISFVLLLKFKVNATWLIVLGAVFGASRLWF
jgi:chromate transporter